MSVSKNSGEKRFFDQTIENTIINDNFTGNLTTSGEIVWSDGYTSRLDEPCPKIDFCELDKEGMVDSDGVSWLTWDVTREPVDNFKFVRKDDKYCLIGTETHCYWGEGRNLINDQKPWIFGQV